jgi:hypothetical protein
MTDQPLLWYRLLPNATYGNGILLGLLIAIVPLILVLVYWRMSRTWTLHPWQGLALSSSLAAFLVVGLIVSTKIGGGGDLHNMDMFLVGLAFTAVLAWKHGGAEWLRTVQRPPPLVFLAAILMLVNFGFGPLLRLSPLSFAGHAEWLMRLTDTERVKALGSLPSEDQIRDTLALIDRYVGEAKLRGDVLFMDQRQLLTFGYVQDVELVWEYEKKWLMDKALSEDAAYFEPFYRDLAEQRFSLIISDPLREPIKSSEYQFGEENNAWVRWVAQPILCYYEPMETLPEFRLQLLLPREDPGPCQ